MQCKIDIKCDLQEVHAAVLGGLFNLVMRASKSLSNTYVLWVVFFLLAMPYEVVHGVSDAKGVHAKVYLDASALRRGSRINLMVLVKLPPGMHVNSNDPKDEWLIPTTLVLEAPEWLKVEGIHYPPSKMLRTSFGELSVYEGKFAIVATLVSSLRAPLGKHKIIASLHYQACDERRCYPPRDLRIPFTIVVVEPHADVSPTNMELFERYTSWLVQKAQEPTLQGQRWVAFSASERISLLIRRFGWALTLLIIFGFGVALNLTPCVFPLVPITIGYFATRSHGSMARLTMEALLYVFGIALTYSIMGVAAGLTGGLFGALLQHPITLMIVSGIIALLALGMFGVYEIELPAKLLGVLHRFGQTIGPFGLGMVAGLIAAPCIGPFTAALIAFVAVSGSATVGFFCFLALSLGLGMPYIFLAIFSGSLHRLPKSGIWMEWVRKALGFALLALAIYLVMPLLPGIVAPFVLPGLLLIASIHLGWLIPSQNLSEHFDRFRKIVGIAMFACALTLLMHGSYIVGYERGHNAALSSSAVARKGSVWKSYSEEALRKALSSGKPVLIKFTANWCPECKILEHQTLSDKEVLNELERLTCLSVDLTFKNDVGEKLVRHYKVVGLPTLIFVGSDGNELAQLRVEGFIGKGELLKRLSQLR